MNNKNFDLDDEFQPQHLAEFATSAIDRDLIALNFSSIGQDESFGFLIREPKRNNSGRLAAHHLRLFKGLVDGGWKCSGVDPLTMEVSNWGCVKPNIPRIVKENGKDKQRTIKYEHPHGVSTEFFCLRVTYRLGLKIAKRQGLEAEYLARMVIENLSCEDRGFWQWVLDTPSLKIINTEGAKKVAGLLSAGYLAIAGAGISAGYRSKIKGVDCVPFLVPQLKLFAAKGREIIFCFDQDAKPKTIANVKIAIRKTAKLLQREGCTTSVMEWNYPYKGIDDLIYNLNEEVLTKIVDDRQSLAAWLLNDDFSLASLPQIEVNTRYLDASIKPESMAGKLIGIYAAKGTGKTEWASALTGSESDKGRKILVITHRIQLARALAKRFGLNHISEVRESETGELLGYSLCVDSVHPKSQAKFNPENWEGAIVVIDEVEQVLWHMLNSNTCQGNRVSILRTFDKLLKTVAASDGTIIVADADLSKVSIDYINNLTEHRLDLWLLVNNHNPNQGQRKLFSYKSPANLLEAAEKAILRGEKVIIHCTAQSAKAKWSTQSLETLLALNYPLLRILRIDSETVADPLHPACGCVENINNVVKDYDIVLASPTLETGVSIDVNHFNLVWALVNGIPTVDAVCQTVERVRSNVDRHICITTSLVAKSKIGDGSTLPSYLSQSQQKVAQANLSLLALSGFTDDLEPHHHHSQAWSKYGAKINQGYQDYKKNILDKLEREGYEITEVLPNENKKPAKDLDDRVGCARDINYEAERKDKRAASNPNDIELKELQKKRAKTKEERNKEAKGVLCRLYQTEDITEELIRKDDAGWYPQIRLYYYLTIGREYLAGRDRAKVKSLSPEGFQPFTPDTAKALLSVKVKALEAVKIGQFFGEERVFTKDGLSDWHEQLKGYAADLKKYLGVSIGMKSTPIVTAQRLLGVLGYRLKALDRIRINGVLVRRYEGIDCNFDERNAVLERWLEQQARIDALDAADRDRQAQVDAADLARQARIDAADRAA